MLTRFKTFVRNLVIYEPQHAGLAVIVVLLFVALGAQYLFGAQHVSWSVLQAVAVVGIAILLVWLSVRTRKKMRR